MRYILDGYNLIFRLFDTHWKSLEQQRDRVVPLLWNLFADTKHEVFIVFDSSPEHFFTQHGQRNPPFHLLFSPPPLNADAYILELCHGTTKKRDLTIVSSDRHLTRQVKELGFSTQSVEEFLSHFRKKQRHQQRDEKISPQFSAEKMERYRTLFERRADDPRTFEDL